jgi:imidazolonepropionase-like amidohydrolase
MAESVDRQVDLHGGYVLPAFAEAHHHTVLCEPGRIGEFIDSGILYAGILNARVSSRECQARLHGESGIELVNALAGVTARGAHPSQIGRYFLEESDIDGEWVHYVDSAGELETRWPRIAATQPDLLKIFLSYSEDFERLRDDSDLPSWYRGLDPDLVGPLVERAHAGGLRVAAHVMSARDLSVAVDAGVDLIAHVPGFAPGNAFTPEIEHDYLTLLTPVNPRYFISAAQAAEAAARGVQVMTTVSGAPPNPAVRHNIATLRAAGVTLLVGSDRGEFNAVDEAVYLVEQGLIPAEEVVHSLAVSTPRALFPGRAVGALYPGDEASFVVLGGNPLQRISALRDVRRVTRRGMDLRPAK